MFKNLKPGWLCILVILAAPTLAQEGPNVLQFSFSNPGARSLGFGGAFVALADDATAAFANPAGLIQLSRPEVSIEGRQWSYSTPFTAGGRTSGPPTGIGLDTAPGLRFGESDSDLSGVSFLAAVYPTRRGTFAFYRHQLANFESLSIADGLFAQGADNPGLTFRFLDQRTATRFDIVSYGLSGSFRVGESLSLGLGLVIHQTEISSISRTFVVPTRTVETFFAPNPFTPDRFYRESGLVGNNSDLGLNLGFLWKIDPRWSLGGVYRLGAEIDLDVALRSGPLSSPQLPPGTVLETAFDSVDTPAVGGLGLAYRSRGGAWTASFEWDRVTYSDIVDSLAATAFDVRGLVWEDVNELHFGFEYAFLQSKPLLAIRFGAWHNPDHQLQIRGQERDVFDRALFQPGSDEIHLAVGLGLVLEKVQLDFAADFSDLVDTVSLSAIYGF